MPPVPGLRPHQLLTPSVMKCPFCSHQDNRVIDSRLSRDGDVIRRRRECEGCERRFTTYERVEEILPLVVKKDGRREAYSRQKVVAGLSKACEKRPISIETIEDIADRIERSLQGSGEKELRSARVGEEVMRQLYDLDKVAYVRFASVYRSFQDLDAFMNELKILIRERSQSDPKPDRSRARKKKPSPTRTP